MNAIWFKELRLLLPAWSVALIALAGGSAVFTHDRYLNTPLTLFVFLPATVFLGLSPFGREFGAGLFPALLALPATRNRIWWTKVLVLGAAFLSLFGMSALIWNVASVGDADWRLFWIGTAAGLALVTGGLWTALLFRQVSAAFWFTLLIPGLIAFCVSKFLDRLQNAVPGQAIAVALVLYSMVGFLLAWRLFLRAQDTQWMGGSVSLPGWFCWPRTGGQRGEHAYRPFRAVVRKEFQFHQTNLLLAASLLGLHIISLGMRKMATNLPEVPAWQSELGFLSVLWLAVPWLTGSTAVAEERKLGTQEGHLCLPLARRWQFGVKFATALFWGVVLGGVMLWLLESAGCWMGIKSEILGSAFELRALYGWVLAAAGIGVVSFYTSTLARQTLGALGLAVVLGVTGAFVLGWASIPKEVRGFTLWQGPLVWWVGGAALLVTLIGLSYWNFKRLHQTAQLWRRNLAVLGAWLVFTLVATPLVYHRTWELVLPLEPQHGPARIVGTGKTSISEMAGNLFIVLPDGRLWASRTHTPKWKHIHGRRQVYFIPKTGMFVSGSNWVDVVSTFQSPSTIQVVGLQADGSLWEVFRSSGAFHVEIPQSISSKRIGVDGDWRAVAAAFSHGLALKQDGTIWGWGDNKFGQLGEGPEQLTNGLVRIGQESDWTAIFASYVTSAAVKRDGSLWKWGHLYQSAVGKTLKKPIHQPVPVRWDLPGTNLVALESRAYFDIGVYADGSVQGVGLLWRELLQKGEKTNPRERIHAWECSPVRLGGAERWRGVWACEDIVVALKADGSLWKQLFNSNVNEPSPLTGIGNQSGWIAASLDNTAWESRVVALAADGTLSCWRASGYERDPQALLAPSRRPLWSVNILDRVECGDVDRLKRDR